MSKASKENPFSWFGLHTDLPRIDSSSDSWHIESRNPAKTQKARGIFDIMNKKDMVRQVFGWKVPHHILFRAGDLFEDSSFNFPVFARPCPVVPRHGFVDSTSCLNAEQLNHISLETQREEAAAELLVTKPIDADYSAIFTGGTVTFSTGNDGATSGNNVRYFYLNEDPIAPAIGLDPTVLLEGEVPFYELVFAKPSIYSEKKTTNLVQVRSGPSVPKFKNYIPKEIVVEKIIRAKDYPELLDWEREMNSADPNTTIVDHRGGSLATHYSIHAITNNIAIFTTYLPEVGDRIVPNTNSEITEENKEEFYRAFCKSFSAARNWEEIGYANVNRYMCDAVRIALSCLHNYAAIDMAKDFEVLGACLGIFVRATLAVSAGETRFAKNHINSSTPNRVSSWVKDLPGGRYPVYRMMYEKSDEDIIKSAMDIYWSFTEVSWPGGYGGKAWRNCTRSSIELYNACIERDVKKVVSLFNNVIHEEHNGGKYLNKIISIGDFDSAAENPSFYAIKMIETIIRNLSNAFNFDDSEVNYAAFKKINYERKCPGVSEGRWNITRVSVTANNPVGGMITVECMDGEKTVTFDIPKFSEKILSTCETPGCCTINSEFTANLESVPHWYKYNGYKILSKSNLNKRLDAYFGVASTKSSKKVKGISLNSVIAPHN